MASLLKYKDTAEYIVVQWCRAVAIRFEAVRFVVCAQNATARGVWGACSPRNFLEFRGYEIASATILGPIRCFPEARQQFYMYEYLPFLSIALYSTDLVSAFRLFAYLANHILHR